MKYLKISVVIILIVICIFTLPEFINILEGECVFGLALWSYRIGLVAWIALGIIILMDTNNKHGKSRNKRRDKRRTN